jgi:hypothetical protein
MLSAFEKEAASPKRRHELDPDIRRIASELRQTTPDAVITIAASKAALGQTRKDPDGSSSKDFACFKSSVSKPSVNQP